MPIDFALSQLANRCAQVDACLTADLAARALGAAPDAARATLKLLSDAGFFRQLLTHGLSNKICYQPTAKSAGLTGPLIPKFLRAGLSKPARFRGLLRGHVRFVSHPDLSYLTVNQQTELCRRYGVPETGHARALVGLDGSHYHIFVPALGSEKPAAVIESAASRWLPLLDSGSATLHFTARAGLPADAIRETLTALAPVADCAARELAKLDAEIKDDTTGLAALRHQRRREELAAEVEAAREASYNWLGWVVEAAL